MVVVVPVELLHQVKVEALEVEDLLFREILSISLRPQQAVVLQEVLTVLPVV